MKPFIAFMLAIALLSCARGSAPDDGQLERALAAVEMCYHWAGEAGSGDPDRERQVREGSERDCGQARKLAAQLQHELPDDPALALGILRLNDVGAFDLSDSLKTHLCARAAAVVAHDTSAATTLMADHATLCAGK